MKANSNYKFEGDIFVIMVFSKLEGKVCVHFIDKSFKHFVFAYYIQNLNEIEIKKLSEEIFVSFMKIIKFTGIFQHFQNINKIDDFI
jgi:hypothetical protein